MSAWFRQTRVRLTLAYSATFSLVALVAAAALWIAVATIQNSAIDDTLLLESRFLQSLVTSGDGSKLSGTSTPLDLTNQAGGSGIAAYLFDSDGRLLDEAGPSLSSGALAGAVRRASGGATVLETDTIDGVAVRARAVNLALGARGSRVLVVTRSKAETDQVLGTTASVLVLGLLVLVIVATVLGYGLAQAALRPVREIASTARTFSEQDLHRRITMDLPSDELGDLAATFNGMLARLETAFDSLQRFTADAAHELRAPLALIRTEAEVTLARSRTPEEYQASLATILGEAERLGRLADQLLMLARAEAGALMPLVADVSLPGLVDDTVHLWQPLALDRGMTVAGTTAGAGVVRGDADLLRRLLDNLIDNALRHSPPGGEVHVSSGPRDRGWEIVVADSGPGIPDDAKAVIFERFSRTDQSRGRDKGGAGLGLALCAMIAELHGGSIKVEDTPGGGARFVVGLPASQGIIRPDMRASFA